MTYIGLEEIGIWITQTNKHQLILLWKILISFGYVLFCFCFFQFCDVANQGSSTKVSQIWL